MYEFDTDYIFNARTLASVAVPLRVDITLLYRNGSFGHVGLNMTTVADSSTIVQDTSAGVSRPGKVVGLMIRSPTSVKRGQLHIGVRMGIQGSDSRISSLASGYVSDEVKLGLGHFESPLSEKGHLHWVQEADDAAGTATTTVNLAQINTHRIVRAVIVKYHSSNDVATRAITITLRDIATAAGPTNWSIASDTWISPTLTLTADEEGLFHIGEHGFVSTNDAGTLAYADNASAPNPFPLELEEGETADLIIVSASANAADDYDVWVQYEDWIEP